MGLLNRLFKKLVSLTDDKSPAIEVELPTNSEAKDAHTAMLNISKNLNKISDYFDEHPEEEEEFEKTLKDI